jgi:transcriptional repressor NrdR
MLCPYCGFDQSSVLESRDTEDGKVTRRRRECLKCGKRFTTYERVGNIELKVIKKDGSLEDFDPEKIKKGVGKACWKRPVKKEQIQKIVDEIEIRLLNRKSTRVPSKDIGKMVMNRLKKVDPIAYLRFASVYLDVKKLEDFESIIKEVKNG